MKKIIRGSWLGLVVLSIFVTSDKAFAEEGQSITDFIIETEREKTMSTQRTLQNVGYMNRTIGEEETILLNELRNKGIQVDSKSSEYPSIINSIITNEIIIDDYLKEEIYEYISVYQARIIPLQEDENSQDEFLKERELLLNRTFEDIKTENIKSLMAAEELNLKKNMNRAAVYNRKKPNLKAMNDYAKRWASGFNPQYPKYNNGDCTNFASQILERSGLGSVNKKNDSGLTWYNNGSYGTSTAWRLAHQFAIFWTAEGYPTRTFKDKDTNGVNNYAKAGDFLAYFTRGTYQINHITYVNRKDGNKNIRVSQHSSPRYDDIWRNINVWGQFNQVISIRFT